MLKENIDLRVKECVSFEKTDFNYFYNFNELLLGNALLQQL